MSLDQASECSRTSKGRYLFRDIASTVDKWNLTVDTIGFEKERRTDIQLKEGAPLEQNIRLVPDLTLKTSVTVCGAPNTRYQQYLAIGTVTDPNGVPVSGATVTLRASGGAVGVLSNGRCTTDDLGRYVVSEWRTTSARWILSVESQGLAPYVQSDIGCNPTSHRSSR